MKKGITKATRKSIRKNGEAATRIRTKLLERVEKHMEENPDDMVVRPAVLRLIEGSEHRAFGNPVQPHSGPDGGPIDVETVSADARELASAITRIAERARETEDTGDDAD